MDRLKLIIFISTVILLILTGILYLIFKIQLILDEETLNEASIFNSFKGSTNKKYSNLNKTYKDKSKENRQKGISGEYLVYKELTNKIKYNASLYNGIYIPVVNKITSEIDLLMIHNAGIFCIEVKNLNGGDVLGSIDDKKWSRTVGQKVIDNPIIQNQNHIKHLRNYLKFNNIDIDIKNFYSIITFVGDANIDNIKHKDNNIMVNDLNQSIEFINNVLDNNEYSINNSTLISINDIVKTCLDDKKERKYKRHIKGIDYLEKKLIVIK